MTDRAHMPADSKIPNLLCYEELVEAESDALRLAELRREPARRRSATPRGRPATRRASLYSHRSTMLHTFAIALPDALNCSATRRDPAGRADVPRQRLGPAVRRLHDRRQAGLPRPGPRRQVALRAVRERAASRSRPACRRSGRACSPTSTPTTCSFSTMRRTIIGGSACPPAMMTHLPGPLRRAGAARLGHDRDEPGRHGRRSLKGSQVDLSAEEQFAIQSKQGRAVYGVDMKIVDDDGNGAAVGRQASRAS